MEVYEAKQALRKEVAALKKSYSRSALSDLSLEILSRLEQTTLFQTASCIALYHAIPGEVQTAAFIEKWGGQKKILLPVIEGNDLRMVLYKGNESLRPGVFGILEPQIEESTTNLYEKEIELIVVPGVAFDRQLNRMGRGKGYYDRLLSTLTAPKVGICFGFQLMDAIPVEPFDRKMDAVITEKETIL